MMRLPILALVFVSLPAAAADRGYGLSGFDRLRVDGPFKVEVTLGKSPGAHIDGVGVSDRIALRVEGDTLTVRAATGVWEEATTAARDTPPPSFPTIRITAPSLRAASLIGGGQLVIAGPLRGQRVDLALSGTGSITANTVDAEELNATVIGSGTLTLQGKAVRARLGGNGTTRILAGALIANDLTLNSNGAGETFAQARYTATVFAAGVGAVTVYGKPACRVNKNVQGPVSCGLLLPP